MKRRFIKKAFTLIELLVVIAVVSLLMGIMIPSLSRARNQTRSVICQSNIRQLYMANTGYAFGSDNYYVRAAHDMFVLDNGTSSSGGKHRWHGVRESDGVHPDLRKNIFDPLKGPLRKYLLEGQVKQCPGLVKFVKEGSMNAFEAGCGGYGYNSVGIGSRSYQYGYCDKAVRSSMKTLEIQRPIETVMFTDTASVEGFKQQYLIEYSFCEAPFNVMKDFSGDGVLEIYHRTPSIHFRHLEKTNVVWCDGHISSEAFSFSDYFTPEEVKRFKIGWFGPDSNILFKPFK